MPNEKIAKRVGEALKSARKNLQLSPSDVAQSAGISAGALHKIERGETWPKEGTLTALEGELGVELRVTLAGPDGLLPLRLEPRAEIKEMRHRCAELEARILDARADLAAQKARSEGYIAALESQLVQSQETEDLAKRISHALVAIYEIFVGHLPPEKTREVNVIYERLVRRELDATRARPLSDAPAPKNTDLDDDVAL